MKASDYFAAKGISASFLKACSFSAHAGYKFLHEANFQSDAMAFGSAVHTAILEPHLFNEQYAISEKFDKRTKAGKEGAAAFEAANIGKLILDQDDLFKISKIKENCLAIPAVKGALETFEKEKSLFWSEDGVDFKARLDLVDLKNKVIIDVKTTRSADPREFANQIYSLKYMLQMKHYADAIGGCLGVYAIAIESDTCEVACYNLDEIVFSDYTLKEYKRALEIAKNVLKMTECPSKYSKEIVTLSQPKWIAELV